MKIVIDISAEDYEKVKCGRGAVSMMRKAIIHGAPLGAMEDALGKIRAEIESKYGQRDICEYSENYDYEERDISEYRPIGNISDVLQIIDKYRREAKE